MFQTMLSKQPGYQNSAYKLFDAGFASLGQLQRGPLSRWPEQDRKALNDEYRKGFDSLQDELADAKKNGNQVLIKEHAILLQEPRKLFERSHGEDQIEGLEFFERDAPKSARTNPTLLPDSILLSVQPIFQIRHPILMFPSMLRAQLKAMGPTTRPRTVMVAATLTLSYSRELFDWYDQQEDAMRPKVVDADDIMKDKAAVRQLCLETGLDPDAVIYEWGTREETDHKKGIFLSTINASKGIIPSLAAKGLDLETEKEKWKTEFGDEDGEDLAKFVADAMPDYNYLLSRRTYTPKVDTPQDQD